MTCKPFAVTNERHDPWPSRRLHIAPFPSALGRLAIIALAEEGKNRSLVLITRQSISELDQSIFLLSLTAADQHAVGDLAAAEKTARRSLPVVEVDDELDEAGFETPSRSEAIVTVHRPATLVDWRSNGLILRVDAKL